MSHPFDARAWSAHFSYAVGKFCKKLVTFVRDIDADIVARGWAGAGSHPKVSEAFRLINLVADEILEFERRVAEYELKSLEARGTCNEAGVYSEKNGQRVLQWLQSQTDGLPKGLREQSKRLTATPAYWRGIADMIVREVSGRVQRTYEEGRAHFQLEVAIRRSRPKGARRQETSHKTKEGKWDHVWRLIEKHEAVSGIGLDQKIANEHNKLCAAKIDVGKCERINAKKVAQIRYEHNHPDRHRKENHKRRS